MALVFQDRLEAPVECALEISRALKEYPTLPLRMGVHSGPVSGVIDVNERANVAGAGINTAQRVMVGCRCQSNHIATTSAPTIKPGPITVARFRRGAVGVESAAPIFFLPRRYLNFSGGFGLLSSSVCRFTT
jgi:class 3 adenylate cyclase